MSESRQASSVQYVQLVFVLEEELRGEYANQEERTTGNIAAFANERTVCYITTEDAVERDATTVPLVYDCRDVGWCSERCGLLVVHRQEPGWYSVPVDVSRGPVEGLRDRPEPSGTGK